MSGVAVTLGPTAAVDYFASSPLDDPLSYPGLIPPHSYLLLGPGRFRKLRLAEPPEGRHGVVAVGSNAAPAQLLRKFSSAEVSPVVPVVSGMARELRILPSAHLNAAGYLPWAVAASDSSAEEFAVSAPVFVTFLDDAQLARLDETEPNYLRVPLPPDRHPVQLDGFAAPLGECSIYTSRHGVIVDDRIVGPGPLASQTELLQRLITALGLDVATPAELVANVRSGQLEAASVSALIRRELHIERSRLRS
jgi:hypothetical protein